MQTKHAPKCTEPIRVVGVEAGAGRGNRTPTVLSDLRILSPLRLPISPSRLAIILAYQPCALAPCVPRANPCSNGLVPTTLVPAVLTGYPSLRFSISETTLEA